MLMLALSVAPMKYLLLLSTLFEFVLASVVYVDDPYLQYRPAFARSLPVQILLTGIVLTLTAVLLIHLLFTAQYHWPLAPVNYVLQLSGVTTLLISLIATIHVVLSATLSESVKWPYMLSYIAVNVPPLNLDPNEEGWSFSEKATWLLMTASTSGLIQITHIQFLTLLYPSKLEGRLIFTLLGPLAIVATVMQLLPIGNPQVHDISSAVRNVCNATLSLLFTIALFVWGFLVNRQEAWRTDGGTAVFGVAALGLAVVSTALNFLYIHKEEEFIWLPSLLWAVVLWQNFLGWWWWVGAGSGGGLTGKGDEVEEKLKRRAKRETRRKEAEERRLRRKLRAQQVWQGVTLALTSSPAAFSSSVEVAQSNVDRTQLSPPSEDTRESATPQRRRRRPSISRSFVDEEIELRSLGPRTDSRTLASRSSSFTLTHSTPERTTTIGPRFMPDVMFRWYKSLRRAHIDAARLQAVERAERMRGFGQDRERDAEEWQDTETLGRRVDDGWRCDWFPWRNRPASRTTTKEGSEGPGGEGIYAPDDLEDNNGRRRTVNEAPAAVTNTPPSSFWWWGPLGRWRLQDLTTY